MTAARPWLSGENHNYPDTGCAAGGPSCLACRLPVCIHDLQDAAQRDLAKHGALRERNQRIIVLRQTDDLTTREIAARLGITDEAVRHVLYRHTQAQRKMAAL